MAPGPAEGITEQEGTVELKPLALQIQHTKPRQNKGLDQGAKGTGLLPECRLGLVLAPQAGRERISLTPAGPY